MRELLLILTDFFPSALGAPTIAPPRLPALETVLARSRRERGADWRMRTALQCAPWAAPSTPAAWTAAAWLGGQSAAGAAWLATPVHWFAGLDSVHLHPEGLLRLGAEEQRQLVADFARVFADSPWRLHAAAEPSRELLLTGPAAAATGSDPARFVGGDLRAGLPAGEGGPLLRRLGAEIEMWLHDHPLNTARSERGELPVSALWLWGGGRAATTPAEAPEVPAPDSAARPIGRPPALYGEDSALAALWRLTGGTAEPLPAAYDARFESRPRSVVLLPTGGAEGLSRGFGEIERDWVAPALAALRARRLSHLTLLAEDRAYGLRRAHLGRFWRRRMPWWERFA